VIELVFVHSTSGTSARQEPNGPAGPVHRLDLERPSVVDADADTGTSWTEIGRSLGMTKQSAWEKFSGED
jgi:hypothetical protein